MITGFFSRNSPYVEAHIEIPALGVSGSIQFLLDTGADGTAIMPKDGRVLGIDYRSIREWGQQITVKIEGSNDQRERSYWGSGCIPHQA